MYPYTWQTDPADEREDVIRLLRLNELGVTRIRREIYTDDYEGRSKDDY